MKLTRYIALAAFITGLMAPPDSCEAGPFAEEFRASARALRGDELLELTIEELM